MIHLLDGTYELFRHFYGQRRFNKGKDAPFGAITGVLHTVLPRQVPRECFVRRRMAAAPRGS